MNRIKFSELNHDVLQELIERDGYAVVENVLTDVELNAVREQVNPRIKASNVDNANAYFLGERTIRFGRLLYRMSSSHRLVKHPVVIEQLERILKKSSPAYHLSFTGVMHLLEGQKAQVLHRDNTIFKNTPNTPITIVATMWAIQDFRKENGATVLVPGSHKWYVDRQPTKEELVYAEMPAGSVLFYAGNLIHGSGTCSVGTRTGVAIQYNLSWMQQEEPQFLATPPEYAAKHFDEDLLKLIGYDVISRNCGEIDSKHLLDFLLNDRKNRTLAPDGYEYCNGKCHSLYFHLGEVDTSLGYYSVDDEA